MKVLALVSTLASFSSVLATTCTYVCATRNYNALVGTNCIAGELGLTPGLMAGASPPAGTFCVIGDPLPAEQSLCPAVPAAGDLFSVICPALQATCSYTCATENFATSMVSSCVGGMEGVVNDISIANPASACLYGLAMGSPLPTNCTAMNTMGGNILCAAAPAIPVPIQTPASVLADTQAALDAALADGALSSSELNTIIGIAGLAGGGAATIAVLTAAFNSRNLGYAIAPTCTACTPGTVTTGLTNVNQFNGAVTGCVPCTNNVALREEREERQITYQRLLYCPGASAEAQRNCLAWLACTDRLNPDVDSCWINGLSTTCPRCSSRSKKGLLGLLGLLGIIPLCLLLLCSLLLLGLLGCCRRKKVPVMGTMPVTSSVCVPYVCDPAATAGCGTGVVGCGTGMGMGMPMGGVGMPMGGGMGWNTYGAGMGGVLP